MRIVTCYLNELEYEIAERGSDFPLVSMIIGGIR